MALAKVTKVANRVKNKPKNTADFKSPLRSVCQILVERRMIPSKKGKGMISENKLSEALIRQGENPK